MAQRTHIIAELKKALRESGHTYADVARAIGRPHAFRAVGMANNRNPVAIVVPCHRVIASDGTLCGYGGGLDTKRRLLELEGALTGTLAA